MVLWDNLRKVRHKSCYTCKFMNNSRCDKHDVCINNLYLHTEAFLLTEMVCDSHKFRGKKDGA
jgi:hypothetical protein